MGVRDFDTVWLCGSQELERRTIPAPDMDAALVAAWMDMPTIEREDHRPCDTIRVTDKASGQAITEDVPPFSLPSRGIALAILVFVAGCVALLVAIWMARHGWSRGVRGQHRMLIWAILAAPIGCCSAIVAAAVAHQRRQEAIAKWKKEFGDLRPAVAPENPRLRRVIIARFSLRSTLPRLALGFSAVAFALWLPFSWRLSHGYWDVRAPIFLACGGAMLLPLLPMLRQMLFDEGAALWIQGGELVQTHPLLQCIPIWSISGIRAGRYKAPRAIAYSAILLTGKDDGEFPLGSAKIFSDPPETVVARLNALLRLSPQPAKAEAA
jgi:hypothetical protein